MKENIILTKAQAKRKEKINIVSSLVLIPIFVLGIMILSAWFFAFVKNYIMTQNDVSTSQLVFTISFYLFFISMSIFTIKSQRRSNTMSKNFELDPSQNEVKLKLIKTKGEKAFFIGFMVLFLGMVMSFLAIMYNINLLYISGLSLATSSGVLNYGLDCMDEFYNLRLYGVEK